MGRNLRHLVSLKCFLSHHKVNVRIAKTLLDPSKCLYVLRAKQAAVLKHNKGKAITISILKLEQGANKN